MPLTNHDHSDIPDFIWLWSMTAIFAFAALFPEFMSDELKASLAMALFVDVFGAIIAMAAYMQMDFRMDSGISSFKFPIVIAFWLMTVIVLLKALGFDLFILFGLFLYPLIGWLNFKWKPEWMRWIPSPKHITD